MNTLNRITVYCGSNYGQSREYFDAARQLGHLLAEQGRELVYGGGKIGLMGTLSDAVLAAGGRVTGVIPTFLREKEAAHLGVSELIETPDMASRKIRMMALGDGYIALPGGIGTYEELFEVMSLAQLAQHEKPIGILDVNGFFQPLLRLLEHTAQTGFMPERNLKLLCVAQEPQALLEQMAAYRPADASAVKWQRPAWLDQEAV